MTSAQFSSSGSPLQKQLQRANFQHFKNLQRRINDVTTANLIIDFLDQHSALRAENMGVYLRARETAERYRIQRAKRQHFITSISNTCKLPRIIAKNSYLTIKSFLFKSENSQTAIGSLAQHSEVIKQSDSNEATVWPVLFDPTIIHSCRE